jgi:hypothetical protein
VASIEYRFTARPSLGAEMYFDRMIELTGLMRLEGMTFPGKAWPVVGSMIALPRREKLPERKSASGTVALATPVRAMCSRS